jgi:hypothetical protein
MTQTKLNVAISNFHAGQIVQPRITVTAPHRANAKCHVDLYWLDQGDGAHLHPASFDGTRDEAESWLMAQGVHLDAQGIY